MLKLKQIKKSYKTGDFIQHALKGVDLEFRENEFVAILGPSGSGKTTLLNIIGGLDRYDSGDLIINNKSTKKFKDKDWDSYRNNCIGFVFQSYNLIGHISVLDNVEMGMTLSGISKKKRKQKAEEVLTKVGLKEHMHKKPNQLSGGQMQRVAIARALANDPSIILADEPTGALDSVTSVQIMDLIKEIAKDKLVIMVTHNPDLANEYASRIVEFKDGELIKDSDPIDKDNNDGKEFNIRKTSMSFLTALKLSITNILTKKGRTFLTAFASSIGIIGIALILSLSNGFDIEIDNFEKNTLTSLPIMISKQAMNLSEDQMMKMHDEMSASKEDYPDIDYIKPKKSQMEVMTHKNNITFDYINYLEKVEPNLVSGLSYTYATSLNLINKIDDKVTIIDTSKLSVGALPKTLDDNQKTVIEEKYDILFGRESKEKDEIILTVDSKNRVDESLLKVLGLDAKAETITFDEILNSTIKLVLNDKYYNSLGNFYTINKDLEALYNDTETITLKVVGIVRLKDNFPSAASQASILYTNDLLNYVIDNNHNSSIVKKQQEVDYNVLTGETIDLTTADGIAMKESILSYLGAKSTPVLIQIFPKDFQAKENLLKYLDDYNSDKEEVDKIVYTDQAEIISSLTGSIMDAVTIVLIAFSSISLVVSSVMIGIIMYISVLERTKEIGVLRALGARKKDITRVFNAETFIIGLCSGLLGLIIAYILMIPANILIENLSGLANVAKMNPIHAIILLLVSMLLTVIGGFIPAKIASKKDPVEALRTE